MGYWKVAGILMNGRLVSGDCDDDLRVVGALKIDGKSDERSSGARILR